MSDRFDWLDHLIPIQFLRVLWDALFPSRFEKIVLEGVDGIPQAGFARPLTFCLGCWLMLFATVQTFPWAFKTTGLSAILSSLPSQDRHAVADSLGISRLAGVTIPDEGWVALASTNRLATNTVRTKLGKRFGRIAPNDVAAYIEARGDSSLGLRVRGYTSRVDEIPSPFDQATLVMFVVFGLVPGWLVSHLILHAPNRTPRETRHVHMYNDGWLVVSVLIPFSLATYIGGATASVWPQRALAGIAILGLATWVWRTVRLFRLTHGAPVWRTGLAHVAGVIVALIMALVFSLGQFQVRGGLHRLGL